MMARLCLFTLLSQLYTSHTDGAHEILVEGGDGWVDGWISKSVIVSFDARDTFVYFQKLLYSGITKFLNVH